MFILTVHTGGPRSLKASSGSKRGPSRASFIHTTSSVDSKGIENKKQHQVWKPLPYRWHAQLNADACEDIDRLDGMTPDPYTPRFASHDAIHDIKNSTQQRIQLRVPRLARWIVIKFLLVIQSPLILPSTSHTMCDLMAYIKFIIAECVHSSTSRYKSKGTRQPS
jgi:hypothetical protein